MEAIKEFKKRTNIQTANYQATDNDKTPPPHHQKNLISKQSVGMMVKVLVEGKLRLKK